MLHALIRIRSTLVVLFLALNTTAIAAGPAPAGLDAFVEEGMGLWQVPGMAVTVVSSDEVLFQRGFGVTTPEGGAAVDTHTLFANASTTKAMVAAGLAILADEGKVSLDDPVTRYLPELHFGDPLLTRQVTVRDLLSHRTGLPRTDYWTFLQGMPLDQQIERLARVQPSAPLRARHIYQNTMYELAGLVIERASGQRWDRFLAERLWRPIGMNETFGSRGQAGDRPHVLPHDDRDGVIVAAEWDLPADLANAAGSAWTSIHDMGLWAQFLLRGGVTAGGQRLISEPGFAELFTPQSLIARADFYPTAQLTQPNWTSYGLGWFQQDFQGRKIDFHTGSLHGLVALIGLDRAGDRAMVILGNRDHAEMRHAVLWEVMDRRPPGQRQDWNQAVFDLYRSAAQQGEAQWEERQAQRLQDTRPSLPLAAYTGRYDNALLGELVVENSGGALTLRTAKYDFALTHWHVDTFLLEYGPWQLREFATFQLAPDGTVATLSLLGETLSPVAGKE